MIKWNFKSYENLVKYKGPLMANYALMGDGKVIDGELYEELRGTEGCWKRRYYSCGRRSSR